MNDPLHEMREDRPADDPALTRRVVDRWLHELARQRRRRRVLAVLAPLSAAAVLALGALTVHLHLEQQQRQRRAATGQAVAALIRNAQVTSTFTPQRLGEAIDATAALFDPQRAIALLTPTAPEPLWPFASDPESAEVSP